MLASKHVEPYNSIYSPSYNEDSQSSDVRWSPVAVKNGNLYQTGHFFKCKDYFNEVVLGLRTKSKTESIYGFSFDPTKHPIPKDYFYVLLKSKKTNNVVEGIKNILNPVEKAAGLALTETFDTSIKNTILIKMDSIFIRETYTISMHTLLIRLMYYYEGESLELEEFIMRLSVRLSNRNTDKTALERIMRLINVHFFRQFYNVLPNIVSSGNKLFSSRVAKMDKHSFHNRTGIYYFTRYVYSIVYGNIYRETDLYSILTKRAIRNIKTELVPFIK